MRAGFIFCYTYTKKIIDTLIIAGFYAVNATKTKLLIKLDVQNTLRISLFLNIPRWRRFRTPMKSYCFTLSTFYEV
uniref:Uncharacterized protein n=1 Tax=Lepeophtheirus salmonis TaxID=72036 RepID=A0A0K2VFP3_LEPSM